MKPVNCLSILTPIPEAISNEPSCSNLHDLSTHKDNNSNLGLMEHPQEQSWRIYENDEDNSKSTDALLEMKENTDDTDEEDEATTNYSNNINFSIIKENSAYKLSKSSSNCSVSRASGDITEKYQQTQPQHQQHHHHQHQSKQQQQQPIVLIRSRSGNKTGSKIYEPISSESLTDSLGYMDDFDESCALITSENDKRKRQTFSSSNDVIPKRNSLGVNKAPQIHRFSAGDADKLEKGIKSSLPSTRSLRDS